MCCPKPTQPSPLPESQDISGTQSSGTWSCWPHGQSPASFLRYLKLLVGLLFVDDWLCLSLRLRLGCLLRRPTPTLSAEASLRVRPRGSRLLAWPRIVAAVTPRSALHSTTAAGSEGDAVVRNTRHCGTAVSTLPQCAQPLPALKRLDWTLLVRLQSSCFNCFLILLGY